MAYGRTSSIDNHSAGKTKKLYIMTNFDFYLYYEAKFRQRLLKCVNILKSFLLCRLAAFDPEQLQFVADIRWIAKDFGNIWLISTKFQKFFRRTLNSNEVNLRVIRISTQPNSISTFNNNNHIFFK